MTDGMTSAAEQSAADDPTVFVHERALAEATDIGPGTRIWAFAHVMTGARIGEDCNICDHTFIEGDVIVGDRVTIKSGGISVGRPARRGRCIPGAVRDVHERPLSAQQAALRMPNHHDLPWRQHRRRRDNPPRRQGG